ncbi:hypothetical protein HF568_04030 [Acidithiobacillus ferridurans]|uniref:Uncharacterized protein n=1 Tax=Acidithiobacillus ferridurans TaxID=1232575 RepID=A0A8X8G8J8_ACIFI|nr:hypothetical protein [Acidithiobacillus ferridurans]
MIFWSFFLSFLFSVTAGLSLFLLNGRRHSLTAWVLVAALTLMAAQQGLRALHATAATPAVVTAYTRMGLGFWPGIMVLASGVLLDTRWWVRGVFVGSAQDGAPCTKPPHPAFCAESRRCA